MASPTKVEGGTRGIVSVLSGDRRALLVWGVAAGAGCADLDVIFDRSPRG